MLTWGQVCALLVSKYGLPLLHEEWGFGCQLQWGNAWKSVLSADLYCAVRVETLRRFEPLSRDIHRIYKQDFVNCA